MLRLRVRTPGFLKFCGARCTQLTAVRLAAMLHNLSLICVFSVVAVAVKAPLPFPFPLSLPFAVDIVHNNLDHAPCTLRNLRRMVLRGIRLEGQLMSEMREITNLIASLMATSSLYRAFLALKSGIFRCARWYTYINRTHRAHIRHDW